MSIDVNIRPAVASDASGVVEIVNPIIDAGVYTAFDTPFTVETERRYIEALPARGIFHVAVAGDAIVGFQSLVPFATYTHAFDRVGVLGTYVEWSRRRTGIGSALFEATFAEARRKQYEKPFTYIIRNNYVDMLVVERLLS